MAVNNEPPVKRFKVGPGGVVERLEEAPPIREEDIKKELKSNSPKRHIDGRKIYSNPPNSPSTYLPDNDVNVQPKSNSLKQKLNSKLKRRLTKEELIATATVITGFLIIIFMAFRILSVDTQSSTIVDDAIPQSSQLFEDADEGNLLHLVKTTLSFIVDIALTVIGFILKILGYILGF